MSNLKLLVARRRAELTQQQLAERAGIPQADISRIERGWTPPPPLQQRLADALGVTVGDLFGPDSDLPADGHALAMQNDFEDGQ